MKKNQFYIALFAGAALLASCESDRELNPNLEHPSTFTLNLPEKAGDTYDLAHTPAVTLTCQQPAYGFTAPAVYSVEVSRDNAFAAGKVEVLATTYTSTRMEVSSVELALAATNLLMAAGKQESDFPLSTSVYVRVKSSLRDTIGVVYSNPIQLNLHTYFALPPVKLPENMYLIGAFCGWNWDNAPAMVAVHSHPDLFWRMVYLPEGGLKFNTATNWNNAMGYDQVKITDKAQAGITRDNDGNISVAKAGWYLVVMKAVVQGRNVAYEVSFNKPAVYLFGAAAGGVWEPKDEWMFTIPATADGDFVSMPMQATAGTDDSHIRACVKLDGTDWWQSEFMILDGRLEYRATGGDQPHVGGKAGEKLYINFTKGTGAIK